MLLSRLAYYLGAGGFIRTVIDVFCGLMLPLTRPLTSLIDNMRYRHILMLFGVMLVLLIAVHLTAAFGLRRMLGSIGALNPSRAFLPFLNIESIGEIADRYRDRKPITGKLLAWGSVTVVLALFTPAAVVAYKYLSYNCTDIGTIYAFFFLFSAFLFLLAVFGTVHTVLLGIAYYRIYRIFAPRHAVWLLILSLAFRPAAAVIFLSIRNRLPQNMAVEDIDQLFWPF